MPAIQRNGSGPYNLANAAAKAARTASTAAPRVISTVISAPRSSPGRKILKSANVATTRPAAKARMAQTANGRGPMAFPRGKRAPARAGARSGRLVPGAELGRCLGRQKSLAKAERRYQRDVLGAADERLELRV